MAYQPWALAELTRHRPFVDTGCLVIIGKKLPSDQVTVEFGKAFLILWNGGSIQRESFSYFLEVLDYFEILELLCFQNPQVTFRWVKKSLVQSGSS